MIAKKEFREEREDVYSFWEMKTQLNEMQDAIIEVETKIEECTILELEKRISDTQQRILDLTTKVELEQSKIELINLL
jgi:hypothetical protein